MSGELKYESQKLETGSPRTGSLFFRGKNRDRKQERGDTLHVFHSDIVVGGKF